MTDILTELQTHTRQSFVPIISNQIWRKSPLLYRIFRLSEEGHFGMAEPSYDGRQIVEPLEMAETVTASSGVGAYSTSDEWTAGTTDVLKGAPYDWKMYHFTVKIHNKVMSENKGKARIFDIAAVKLRNGMRALRKQMAEDLYATHFDGTKYFVGLPAFAATTGTVGGVAKGTYDWWQGTTTAASAAASWSLLNKYWYDTKAYGDGDPATEIVASEGVLEKYEDNISKMTDASGSPLRYLANLAGPKVLDGGFSAFYYKRIPMIADPFCPSGELYFLNKNYLHWRVLKQFSTKGWKSLEEQNKDWTQLTYKGYGALTSSNNRKIARLTSVTEA